MSFKTIIKIDKNIKRYLNEKLKIKDVCETISTKIMGIVQDRFQNSVDPDGNQWKALKNRKGKPLLDTGKLRNSIHKINKFNLAGVGTNLDYARVHNEGAKIKYKNGKKEMIIPKRQYMGFTDDDLRELKEEVIEHLNNIFS